MFGWDSATYTSIVREPHLNSFVYVILQEASTAVSLDIDFLQKSLLLVAIPHSSSYALTSHIYST